ncbi:RHS repeat-associated core domain-containing protein, partial [Limisphaera sp. 4302-co]|uniref:RHS repeat-associated core domain-containing protein n=1 Tax=Limisphaera sp. 4302-co TaxID=3400417 RepID=UPI003C17A32B
ELLIHDLDGNLVRDGRWMYYWDAENRLTRVMSYGATDRGSWRRVDWKYDALGGRVRQTSYVLSNGVWQVVEDVKFVSDPELFGRHVAELNATNNAPVRAYIWGLDLSETLGGAGGVGGLLWVRAATGPAAGTHFVCYDGNGNVWNLVSATTGTETARYEYGPFGEPLRLSGPAVKANPFGFSTKRTEDFTGLVLYEYRAYSPSLGRWLSRDPLEEEAFTVMENMVLKECRRWCSGYVLTLNNPAHAVDLLGLRSVFVVVQTEIRGPDPEPGKKTWHAVELTDACTIDYQTWFTGITEEPFPTQGIGLLRAFPSGSPPICRLGFIGHAASFYILAAEIALGLRVPQTWLHIDYALVVGLNWCTRTGWVMGVHDGYPSYTVQVNGRTVYDHHQSTIPSVGGLNLGILKLLPPMDVRALRRFTW